jgi:hypothetical protein
MYDPAGDIRGLRRLLNSTDACRCTKESKAKAKPGWFGGEEIERIVGRETRRGKRRARSGYAELAK